MRSVPRFGFVLVTFLIAGPAPADDALIAAARGGNLVAVKQRLAAGADVNAKTAYGATALSYACDKGHLEVVKALLAAKADPNVKDKFYQATPITWAVMRGHMAVAVALIEGGSDQADFALETGAARGQAELVEAALKHGKPAQAKLDAALASATDP